MKLQETLLVIALSLAAPWLSASEIPGPGPETMSNLIGIEEVIHYRDGDKDAVVSIKILDVSQEDLEKTLKAIVQTMDFLGRETDKRASCRWSGRTVETLAIWTSRKLLVVQAPGGLPVSAIIAWSRSQAVASRKRNALADTVEKLRAPCESGVQ
mgnify:CR=1 FL=1